jgi:hypothetical protein
MGTIDKTIHKLTCETCRIVEEVEVLDKGSNWGGSHWQNGENFENFETSWDGGGKTEPHIITAVCRHCGENAKSESRFGGI